MLLAVDIGNTNTVLGVFQGDRLLTHWRLTTQRERTADEYGILCRNLFSLWNLDRNEIRAVVVASVVPPTNFPLREMCREYFGLVPFFVNPAGQSLISVRYQPITDVGADRIVNAVAAVELYGKPAIVIDLGTATTFDVISDTGVYLGGVIAPGLGISAEALFSRAARLPRVEIRRPDKIIGSSTVESMQSGLFHGYVCMVTGLLNMIRQQVSGANIVATGGFADSLISELSLVQHVDPNLTLHGLRIFYERFFKGREAALEKV
ncbi:MAG: type III pantothenate kinase [Acidobacteria bacterium]|nr:type III pantothenate kinase [Acidobacteriota bacterium]